MTTIQHRQAAQRTLVALQLRLGGAAKDVRRALIEAQTIVTHPAHDVVDPGHAINNTVLRALAQTAELLDSLELRTSLLVGNESRSRLSNHHGDAA